VHKTHLIRSRVYLLLAALGLITAWYFNAIASFEGQDYLRAWFGSAVDWVLSLDLMIVAGAATGFMIIEARRLKMKRVWLYFLLSGITALAFTFPLFLAMRELKLRKEFLAGGDIDEYEFDNHKVQIWTPENWHPQTPVLVMHDGKNVFDSKSATFGKTWEVLKAIKTELRSEQPIVVAVWGKSDATRVVELAPESFLVDHPEVWKAFDAEYIAKFDPDRTPQGDAYISLIAEAILPFVADTYGIELQRERVAILGASMGGLASFNALAERPNVFGTAIGFSTHWTFGKSEIVKHLIDKLPNAAAHRIWTDTGTEGLDSHYLPFHKEFQEQLQQKGFKGHEELVAAVYPATGHSEYFWARRVADALNWWLKV
jgi:predicted alpha/beta superfamily hydrolase